MGAFERFTQVGRRFKLAVSIWSRGQISFNQGVVNRCNLKDTDYVVLFFDRYDKKIGFQITGNNKEEGAIKLKMIATGALISAKPFLDYYGVDYTKTTRYELEYNDANRLHVVDLTKQMKEAKVKLARKV